VTLELDKSKYLLGENVLVHYVLENTGEESFQIDMGGDYRAASRPLRYQVMATDENGKLVPDPDPWGFFLGGLSFRPEVKPGEKWVASLPLLRYCKFDKPGRYNIRVKHDLGWREEDGRKRPVGETIITLRMPSPRQAERLVAKYERMSVPDDFTAGRRRNAYADFSTLRLPVYLEPLSKCAARGFQPAIAGIGSIETAEATAALIDLLDHKDAQIALLAARTLNNRLPDPHFRGELPGRAFDASTERRKQLALATWDAKFAERVRARAVQFLSREETEFVNAAAFMLQCVGSRDDFPLVIAVINRSLAGLQPRREPDAEILNPPGASYELLRVMRMLGTRGAELSEEPQTVGQIVFYLDKLAVSSEFRPPGWSVKCVGWLDHDNPFVRESVLRNTPLPLPDGFKTRLPQMLADADLGVQRAACQLAQKTREESLAAHVVTVFAKAKHPWVLNAARNAAVALGAKADILKVSAERMHEPDMLSDAMTSFAMIVKHGGSRGGNTNISRDEILAMQKLWLEFLDAHFDEIQLGKLFEIGDPLLKPELFGRACTFHLKDDTSWPRSVLDKP
jgi:hypothetical protein